MCCGGEDPLGPPGLRWGLEDGKADIALLQIDFTTYQLEGGVLETYVLCDSCDLNTIPLRFTNLRVLERRRSTGRAFIR